MGTDLAPQDENVLETLHNGVNAHNPTEPYAEKWLRSEVLRCVFSAQENISFFNRIDHIEK